MALSYYSNWGPIQHLNADLNVFMHTIPELPPETFGFAENLALSDIAIHPIFEPEELFYSDNYTQQLPSLSPPYGYLNSLSPEILPFQDFRPFEHIKCQKTPENSYYSDCAPGLCTWFVPNPPVLPELLPEVLSPTPEFQFQSPPVYDCGIVESVKKSNERTLSTQSIAARQRRRKITEKTQELGKLIPGGQNMNTAEMFQTAFKYVKYLQAQVGILEFMGSIQDNEESFYTEELQDLLGSPFLQEKLSSMEKCLVPKIFVQTLAEEGELQSNTTVLKNIKELIRTGG
ncbi:unnamed protein product [Ilex paraguariensis]|uniref:BHLH domain-containing protein n=1 Tax=Ilex paraguariensis TaxID=185542 RepID=A0ABC8S2V3_9AQUA